MNKTGHLGRSWGLSSVRDERMQTEEIDMITKIRGGRYMAQAEKEIGS